VTSAADEFRSCNKGFFTYHAAPMNVVIKWFVFERSVPLELPDAEMIEEGYDPTVDVDYIDPAGFLYEHFTEAEANALADYLVAEGNGRPVITPAKLPIPLNAMPFSNFPLGGPQDCLLLYQCKTYTLPFKVEGYFDRRQHW
jgi:hypothetical protein